MRRASALVLLVGLVVASCGDSSLAAIEYFPAVEAELSQLDLSTKDLTGRFVTELEAELEKLVATADFSVPGAADRALEDIVNASRAKMQSIIEAHTGQVDGFADRVDELVPPKVVAAAHGELVAAFTNWAESGAATITLLQDATDLDALGAVLTASPYADAQVRVDQACQALTDGAASVEVELTCPGTQLEVLDVGQ